MSKKENLIHKYFELKNKFDILEGCERPRPKNPSNEIVNYFKKEFRIIDLEDKINAVENAIEQYVKSNKQQILKNAETVTDEKQLKDLGKLTAKK